jgi:hypothetical protein
MSESSSAKPDLHKESILRDWLTETLYPREYAQGGSLKSAAKKRIASRLHYARKTGELKAAAKSDLDLAAFFEWACEQKGWEVLQTVPDLPRNATVNVASPPASCGKVGRIDPISIPTDPKKLKEALLLTSVRAREAESVSHQLKSTVKELQERLRVKEKKAVEGSKHGKKGLGIKKPR